jgi:heme/copper-type cytochrome/quinol oxidase subunit 2
VAIRGALLAAAFAARERRLSCRRRRTRRTRIASTQAYIFVLVFTGIIFFVVEGALIAFAVRYRRGKRARTAEGPQIHGATRLEIIWTVVPV